ncbi:MAG: DUF1800 domain-containing protein [Acidobacteriaceae bacterium]
MRLRRLHPVYFCLAGLVCLVVAEQPLRALHHPTSKHASPATVPAQDELQGDERILHVLNRLTFGPRPGDLQAIKAMGLQKWMDQQLHPQGIEDAELQQKLSLYPAMQLKLQQLVYRFPSPPLIRQATDGLVPIPSNPYERAIYVDQIARYRARLATKQEAGPGGNAAASRAMNASLPGDTVSPGSPAMQQLYADLDATEVINLPPNQRMVRLIAMQPDQLERFRKSLTAEEREALVADLTPQQRETVLALQNPRQVVAQEVMESRLMRDIYSNRQLEAVMTDFWLNHFNVYINKGPLAPYYLASYERDTIRPHALGKFEDLLDATAKSPAMLFYLDNFSSIGPDSLAAVRAKQRAEFSSNPNAKQAAMRGINENYGRELMELHTLGVNGGYTQQDVIQVARCFTGWTIDRPFRGGGFIFDERRHEPGDKIVLGHRIHAAGEKEGLEVLHILATSPATAHFVSRELAVRFVSDHPPQSLVDRMAKAWLASDGDIRTVLKTMFASPEFWAKSNYHAKIKTPLEYVTSAVRASDANVQDALPLVQALNRMGMPLYGSQPPTGYGDVADDWVSTGALVNRMNFALLLSSNRLPGVDVDWNQMQASEKLPVSMSVEDPLPSQREAQLEQVLMQGEVSAHTRESILKQLLDVPAQEAAVRSFPIKMDNGPNDAQLTANKHAAPPTFAERQTALMAGLLLGSPEFQKR